MADIGRIKKVFDADLELADHLSTAITSTTTDTAVNIPVAVMDNAAIRVIVTDADDANSDETYVISFEVDTTSAMGSAVEIATYTHTRGTTCDILLPISGQRVEELESGADYIHAKATLGGTTPSLKYQAYIVPA